MAIILSVLSLKQLNLFFEAHVYAASYNWPILQYIGLYLVTLVTLVFFTGTYVMIKDEKRGEKLLVYASLSFLILYILEYYLNSYAFEIPVNSLILWVCMVFYFNHDFSIFYKKIKYSKKDKARKDKECDKLIVSTVVSGSFIFLWPILAYLTIMVLGGPNVDKVAEFVGDIIFYYPLAIFLGWFFSWLEYKKDKVKTITYFYPIIPVIVLCVSILLFFLFN